MMAYVRVLVSGDFVEVRLAPWEKALGLARDLRLPLADVCEVEFVADPMAAAMTLTAKVGMRIPWLYYVAHSIGFDQLIVVRRHESGLSFSVRNRPQAAEGAGERAQCCRARTSARRIGRLLARSAGMRVASSRAFGAAQAGQQPQAEKQDQGGRADEGEARVVRAPEIRPRPASRKAVAGLMLATACSQPFRRPSGT